MAPDSFLAYSRSRFSTRLPTDRSFTRGHFWLAMEDAGIARVGFTKFATRMLGEVVELEFEATAGAGITTGRVVGWLEGFKAVSDLYAPADGIFVGGNPNLEDPELIERIHKDPYGDGWLYRMRLGAGLPDDALTPDEYARFLDGTIDRMMGTDSGETEGASS